MGKKILIVDDNSDNQYMLETLLREEGLQVTSAVNGEDALAKARLNPPDLIVTDILMPVMDGYALCRRWKADDTLKRIPLVLYTATYTSSKDEEFALSLGADRFIIKPQEPNRLMKLLGEVLDEKYSASQVAGKPLGEEMEFFRRHNEALFSKLEKKMLDLETANRELKNLEERYRLSFENVSDVIYVIDADFNIASISPGVEKILGYKPQDFTGRPIQDLRHVMSPESFQRAVANIGRVLGGETLSAITYEFIAKDGSARYGEVTESPIISAGGIIGVIAVARDVTERKRAEDALRDSHRRLDAIVDFLPDATFVIDRGGKVIAWNLAMEMMTGVKKDSMLGKADYEYAIPFYGKRSPILIDLALHPDSSAGRRKYQTIRKVGDALFTEGIAPNLPSRALHLSAAASVLRDEKGEVIGAIECIRDNTERKGLEERLNRAEKMEVLGTLAGGVAHDLNNLIGVMVGYSELLLQQLPAGSPLRKHADNIMRSSVRSAAIIQDLLTLARRGVSISEVVNFNRMVSESLRTPEFEQLKVRHPAVEIRADLADGLLNIEGSPVHLSKTLLNLLSNGVESINGPGEVTIRTENRYLDLPVQGYDDMREGEYVVLVVSDTGRGIAARDLGKIFEPFYTKKIMGKSGTGLGLAVVWGTVKDHHGYIDVHSEEGKGATFTLYFPATRDEAAAAERTASLAAYKGSESILIVDDMKEQRELALSMLGRFGYHVEAVPGGEDAVARLRNGSADLVVLDMIMDSGMDGLDTYREILKIHPRQKAIIVSGFAETDRVRHAQALGAGAFVRKPYIMEKIGLAVRQELDRK